jgi:hypothetical protein
MIQIYGEFMTRCKRIETPYYSVSAGKKEAILGYYILFLSLSVHDREYRTRIPYNYRILAFLESFYFDTLINASTQ